jgi:hypothetical protein
MIRSCCLFEILHNMQLASLTFFNKLNIFTGTDLFPANEQGCAMEVLQFCTAQIEEYQKVSNRWTYSEILKGQAVYESMHLFKWAKFLLYFWNIGLIIELYAWLLIYDNNFIDFTSYLGCCEC